MKVDFKKLLLAGTALVAVGSFSATAQAATELTDGATLVASDLTGLVETTATTTTVTINTNAGALSFGSGGAPTQSLVMNATGQTLTVNVDTSGANNLLTFADDIVETAGDIIMNIVDTDTQFQGNVGNIVINAGSASANPTIALKVDTAFAENIAFAGSISAVDAADTVNLTVTNTVGGARTVTFSNDLGGSTAATALDAIVIGADTVNAMDVTFAGNVNATSIATAAGAANNNTANIRFGTSSGPTSVTGTIAGGDAADTVNVTVVGGAIATFNSAFGANIDAIQIGADAFSTSVNFKAGLAAGPVITIGAGAGTVDTNVVGFDATTASFTVNPAIVGGNAADTNSINVSGGAGRTVTFASAIGAGGTVDNLTLAASTGMITQNTLTLTGALTTGASSTFDAGGSVTAPTISLGSGSTMNVNTAGSTITGDINGAATLNFTSSGASVVGGIGNSTTLTALNVANGADVTINATAAGRVVAATTTTLTGTGALNFTPGANTINVSNAITAAATGNGSMTIADGNGTVAFGGNIGTSAAKVGTLTITNGAGTNVVNAAGNVYVNTVALGTGDTLNLLATTGTLSGTVDGNGGAGRGSIVVGNGTAASNYTFGSVIGTTTNTVAAFKVSAASTGNISKNVATTASGAGVTGFENQGTLNVDASANTVTMSTAVGKTVLNGTTTITGAQNVSATAGGALSVDGTLSTILSGANKTLTLTGATNSIGTNSSTTITAGNQIVLGAATTIGANGKLTTLNIAKTAAFDPATTTVVAGGANAVTVAAGTATLKVGLASSSTALGNGDAITVITSTGGSNFGTLIGNGTIVLQNTGLVSFADNGSDATALKVKASFINPATVLSSSTNVSVATALQNFPTATGELATARGNLLAASNATAANLVAESLAPPADGAVVTAAVDVSNHVFSMNTMRLAALRNGGGETGIAAGNGTYGARGWGQVFGRTATQDRREGTAGYDADTGGLAVGLDGATANGGNVGLALSYAQTSVDSENANTTETDINSYQISLYGEMPLEEHLFLNGMVGYVFNDNQSTRHNVGGIAGLNANADFDAHQLMARAMIGRDFLQSNGLTLTPNAMVSYSYYNASEYTESGAGTANLRVDPDAVNALELGVGVDAKWDIVNGDGSKFQPTFSANYRYDVIGDSFDTTSSFTGGGAAFGTQGVEPAQGMFNLGAAIKYYATNQLELSAEYDYDTKSDYSAHAAQLRAAYKF